MPNLEPRQLVPGGVEKEPEIHTIPEQFLGVAGKAKIHKSEKKKPPEALKTSPPAKAPALPGAPVPKPIQAKKGSKKWVLIPVGAILFVALLGAGTWLLLRQAQEPEKKTEQPATTVIIQQPTPESVEEIIPEPVPEPEPEPEPEPKTNPSDDNDGDGLTMAEEALYGTSDDNTDSDKDGFSDMIEVTNLYNPAGFKPTRLLEAGLVREYQDDVNKFELLYPNSWKIITGVQDEYLSLISSELKEGISISDAENTEEQTVLDWYLSRNPQATPVQVSQFSTKSGLEGILSPDGYSAYIAVGSRIYALQYVGSNGDPLSSAEGPRPLFLSTFTMILNSFSALP